MITAVHYRIAARIVYTPAQNPVGTGFAWFAVPTRANSSDPVPLASVTDRAGYLESIAIREARLFALAHFAEAARMGRPVR